MSRLDSILDSWKLISVPIIGDTPSPNQGISVDTLLECVGHFEESGGSVEELLQVMRAHLAPYLSSSSSTFDHSSDFVRHPPGQVSTEYYWLFCMEMKRIIGDWGYHFDYDSDLFSRDHRLFELGPIDGDIYAEESEERLRAGVGSDTFAVAIAVFRQRQSEKFYRQTSEERGVVVGPKDANSSVARHCAEYCDEQVSDLLMLVNSFLLDERYHVSEAQILRSKAYFSLRFANVFYDFLRIMCGDEGILSIVGQNNMPEPVKRLARPFSVEFTYRMVPFFSNRFTKLIHSEFIEGKSNHAVIRIHPTTTARVSAGKYLRRVFDNSSEIAKNVMYSIPESVFGIDPKPLIESASFPRGTLCNPSLVPLSLDSRLRREIISRRDVPEFTEVIYGWEGHSRGWVSFFLDATDCGEDFSLPTLDDMKKKPAYSLRRILRTALSMTPVGSVVLARNVTKLRKALEDVSSNLEDRATMTAESGADRVEATVERTHGRLYQMGVEYQRYLDSLELGKIAAAREHMGKLRFLVLRYLNDVALEPIHGSEYVGLRELRKKIDAATLFLAFGEVVDGTFDPLTGRSGSAVFLTNANAEGARIAKRFALKEMGKVEALVYDWFSRRSLYDRQRFPTPDMLAYRVVPTKDETGSPVDVPIMMMETIEGPTLYDFFRRLNACVSPGLGRNLAAMKDRMIEGWINRYCYIAEESQSSREGSLGAYLDSKGVVRIASGDYVSKVCEVFDADAQRRGSGADKMACLSVVAEQLGSAVAKVRKVPFADMSPLNGSMPAKSLYSKVVSLCRGVDPLMAEAALSGRPVEDVTGQLLEEIVTNMSAASERSELFDVCSQEIVRFDFEKMRMDTVEFDDLCHIVDFLPYGPSVERRERMNALYIALRYIPEGFTGRKEVMQLFDEGKTSEAVTLMGKAIDYRGLESQRAIVSIYRNLRWMRFYSGLDDSKFDELHSRDATVKYHASLVVQDISRYLGLNPAAPGTQDVSGISEDSLRAAGLPTGFVYLRKYLEEEA